MPEHLPRSADGHNIRVDGVPLHYRRGSAGPTVVPIHGASGNLRDWTFGAMPAMAEADPRPSAPGRPRLRTRAEARRERGEDFGQRCVVRHVPDAVEPGQPRAGIARARRAAATGGEG